LGIEIPNIKALMGALAQRGYTVGKKLAYETRAAGGHVAKLPQLLQEFKAGGVDALVTVGPPPPNLRPSPSAWRPNSGA